MSEIVKTIDGLRFNRVTDGINKYWMLECPVCGERLPLTKEMFQGNEAVVHASLKFIDTYCEFREPKPFGASLVAAMQANILFDGKPLKDQDQEPFA